MPSGASPPSRSRARNRQAREEAILRGKPSLWSCRRSPDAVAGTLTGVTPTELDAQRAGPLEEFLDGGHPGGWKDPLGASLYESRGKTGCAIELPLLHSAAEETLNLPLSELPKSEPVHVTRPCQQKGAHPRSPSSCPGGESTTTRGTSGSGPRRSSVSIATHSVNARIRMRSSRPTRYARPPSLLRPTFSPGTMRRPGRG